MSEPKTQAKASLVWFLRNSLEGHGVSWSAALEANANSIVDNIILASKGSTRKPGRPAKPKK